MTFKGDPSGWRQPEPGARELGQKTKTWKSAQAVCVVEAVVWVVSSREDRQKEIRKEEPRLGNADPGREPEKDPEKRQRK